MKVQITALHDIAKLNKICTFNIINFMKKNQFEFKPFDKVLVRDNDDELWRVNIYSNYVNDGDYPHKCVGNNYAQCIPYDENTAYLLGTNQPYSPPQPKEYHASWDAGNDMEQTEFSAEELERFIKIAVINNKDVTNFTVRRIR